jgi:hypothetical protein
LQAGAQTTRTKFRNLVHTVQTIERRRGRARFEHHGIEPFADIVRRQGAARQGGTIKPVAQRLGENQRIARLGRNAMFGIARIEAPERQKSAGQGFARHDMQAGQRHAGDRTGRGKSGMQGIEHLPGTIGIGNIQKREGGKRPGAGGIKAVQGMRRRGLGEQIRFGKRRLATARHQLDGTLCIEKVHASFRLAAHGAA